jgi:hypothetical protein
MCANGELQVYSYGTVNGEVTVKIGLETDRKTNHRLLINLIEPGNSIIRGFEVRVYRCPSCGGDLSIPVEPLEPEFVIGREYIDSLILGVELKRRIP